MISLILVVLYRLMRYWHRKLFANSAERFERSSTYPRAREVAICAERLQHLGAGGGTPTHLSTSLMSAVMYGRDSLSAISGKRFLSKTRSSSFWASVWIVGKSSMARMNVDNAALICKHIFSKHVAAEMLFTYSVGSSYDSDTIRARINRTKY